MIGNQNIVGKRVGQLRKSLGWNQEQLAAKCGVLGWDISRGTLAKIEAQVRKVTDTELVLLAKALKVSVSELFS